MGITNKEAAILLLLFIQVLSLIYCIAKGLSPLDSHYGVSVWMSIPVCIINIING